MEQGPCVVTEHAASCVRRQTPGSWGHRSVPDGAGHAKPDTTLIYTTAAKGRMMNAVREMG